MNYISLSNLSKDVQQIGKSVTNLDTPAVDTTIDISIIKNIHSTNTTTPGGAFDWARTVDGSSSDVGRAVATDPSGNVYIAGNYNGTAVILSGTTTLHTLPASSGGNGGFIIKLTSAGAFEWARTIDGSAGDIAMNIATDTTGNVYVTGFYQNTATILQGSTALHTLPGTSGGGQGAFIVKLTSTGAFDWARTIDSSSGDEGSGITTDTSGNVYIIGYYRGNATIWQGSTSLHTLPATTGGSLGGFIVKLTSAGAFDWARIVDGTGSDTANGIATDATGNVYVTGYYQQTAAILSGSTTLHTLPASTGSTSAFIVKFTSVGALDWVRVIDSSATEESIGIATDASGNVYVTGYYQGTASIFHGTTTLSTLPAISSGTNDAFIVKFTTNGTFDWARVIEGSSSSEVGYDIATDATGNVYIIGNYHGTARILNGSGFILHTLPATSGGSSGTFIVKLTSTGSFDWARVVDGSSTEEGYGIVTDTTGNVYITGYYLGTASILSGSTTLHTLPATSSGSAGAFIVKLSGGGTIFNMVPYTLSPPLQDEFKEKYIYHATSSNSSIATINHVNATSNVIKTETLNAGKIGVWYWLDGNWVRTN